MTGIHPRRHNGFTLLELLVALAVFSLVVLGLTQGLRFGLQAWAAQTRVSRSLAEIDSVDRLLRELLASIPVTSGGSLTGGLHQVSFLGSLPRAAPPGLRDAQIKVLVIADHRLILRWTPSSAAKSLFPPAPTDTDILDGVAAIEFAYYNSPKSGWQTSWKGPGIPALVRVHIDFLDGDPRHWPEIVIAPMVEGN